MKINSVATSCECPNILELKDPQSPNHDDEILFTEGAGCDRNITCGSKRFTHVAFYFKDSEIVLDDGAPRATAALFPYPFEGEETGLPVDIFILFGMMCENKEWYVTKYPTGFTYHPTGNSPSKLVGTNGEYDGKKSKIHVLSCAPVLIA
ncbi:hypothetical protein GCK72_007694 [Caenorhabditis remanei]|uniref:Uncharacterized protein n=1 Tax=Caenorhabditis remanei TaxID=31234 RepID=A0A6A5HJR0_CAERE|nr:hypothetical protein GCK72_007694 [Caenorhabditis remanei]KAF1767735.1 hypothetical protein GCK72_007694 [Caenorhabditis remanei]